MSQVRTFTWTNANPAVARNQLAVVEVDPVFLNQYWFAGVVNVIPELPPQSPDPPVIADKFHDPAPAPVMSRKFTFVIVTVAAVSVLAVPIVLEVTKTLLTAEFPFIVKVPVIVLFAVKLMTFVFDDGPVCVKVAKVLAPAMVDAPDNVETNTLYVKPPP